MSAKEAKASITRIHEGLDQIGGRIQRIEKAVRQDESGVLRIAPDRMEKFTYEVRQARSQLTSLSSDLFYLESGLKDAKALLAEMRKELTQLTDRPPEKRRSTKRGEGGT